MKCVSKSRLCGKGPRRAYRRWNRLAWRVELWDRRRMDAALDRSVCQAICRRRHHHHTHGCSLERFPDSRPSIVLATGRMQQPICWTVHRCCSMHVHSPSESGTSRAALPTSVTHRLSVSFWRDCCGHISLLGLRCSSSIWSAEWFR